MLYFDDMNNQVLSSKFIIYALHHPSSRHMYIGQSARGALRPRLHGTPYFMRTLAHLPRTKWIRSLRERGLEHEIVVLEECCSRDALAEAEVFYIAYFRSLGIPLLNLTDGGEGTSGYRFTPEHCSRISASLTGKKRSPEACAALSRCKKGIKRPESVGKKISVSAAIRWETEKHTERGKEHLNRLRNAVIAGWRDPETRAKWCAARRGKTRSAEHRANLSAALKGKSKPPMSDETKARLSAALKGRAKPPGYGAKISAANKKRWSDPVYRQRMKARQEHKVLSC